MTILWIYIHVDQFSVNYRSDVVVVALRIKRLLNKETAVYVD
jgi:hypothetical protein